MRSLHFGAVGVSKVFVAAAGAAAVVLAAGAAAAALLAVGDGTKLQTAATSTLPYFHDVDEGSVHAANIERAGDLGIAAGTSVSPPTDDGVTTRTFSPSEPVTRGQMATFMARAWTAAGQTCPANADSSFSDVASGSTHAAGINCMAALEIARGTTAGTFLPSEPVSRGQMATFLIRFYEALSDAS